MQAGKTVTGKESLAVADLAQLLRAATEGVQARGKASLGDKTLLDVLHPASEAFVAAISAGKSLVKNRRKGVVRRHARSVPPPWPAADSSASASRHQCAHSGGSGAVQRHPGLRKELAETIGVTGAGLSNLPGYLAKPVPLAPDQSS